MQANAPNYSRNLTIWSRRSVTTLCRSWNSPCLLLCSYAGRDSSLRASIRTWQLTAHSFAACHASIMIRLEYSHTTWVALRRLNMRVPAANGYRCCTCENMRRVNTIQWWYQKYIDHVWHFMRLSVFRFHSSWWFGL